MEHPWDVKQRQMTERSRAEERVRLMVSQNMRRPTPATVPTTSTVPTTATVLDLDRLRMLLLEMPPIDNLPVVLTAAQVAKLKATTLEQAREDLATFGLAVMEPDQLVAEAIDTLMPGADKEHKAFLLRWVMAAMISPPAMPGKPYLRGPLME